MAARRADGGGLPLDASLADGPLHRLRRSPSPFRGGLFYLALLGLWAAASLLYWWAARADIAAWNFPDPDDQMRLLQVRDWLGGQSWWDVTQHRMNPPVGAPMHWSRVVDLPIAGAILLARPFATTHGAELFACVAAPIVTLGGAMLLIALAARRLIGDRAALAVAALAPFTTGALQQMHALRIDHHGWQMVMAAGMLLGALDRKGLRGGIVAGLCAAIWLEISLEGLPFAAATGALFGLRWLLAPADERGRLTGYALALAGSATALFVATKAPADWRVTCDALSTVHLGVLGLAAGGVVLATFGSRLPFPIRLALLGATGIACGLAYVGIAPQCRGGAFAQLDPLVYRYWYLNIPEGLPLWDQHWRIVITAIGYPSVALAGAILLRSRAADRRRWDDYLLLLAASMLITVTIQRAGAVANLLALPAGVALMARAIVITQRLRMMLPRVFASAMAALALMPIAPGIAAAAIPDHAAGAAPGKAETCDTSANLATAGRLPPAILLTGLDIGPGVLLMTDQRVIASSHHRNAIGMHDVMATFLSDEATAHAIVRRHHAGYIVVCPKLNEMDVYRRSAANGLWANLAKGHTPAWLRPVRIPGSTLAVWQVVS